MSSLTDLNNFSSQAVEFEDEREPAVVFNIYNPATQFDFTATETEFTVIFPLDILEIDNIVEANVRFRLSVPNDYTVDFGTLAPNLLISQTGGDYTVSGITGFSDWNTIKGVTVTIPNDLEGAGAYSASILWNTLQGPQTYTWNIGVFRPLGLLASEFDIEPVALRFRPLSGFLNSKINFAAELEPFYFSSPPTQEFGISGNEFDLETIELISQKAGLNWQVLITPSNPLVLNLSVGGTGGSVSIDGNGVITITGTTSEVNSRLSNIKATPGIVEQTVILDYTVILLNENQVYTTSQTIKTVSDKFTQPRGFKTKDSFIGVQQNIFEDFPVVLDFLDPNATYSLTLSVEFGKLRFATNISPISYSAESNTITITGNQSFINARLQQDRIQYKTETVVTENPHFSITLSGGGRTFINNYTTVLKGAEFAEAVLSSNFGVFLPDIIDYKNPPILNAQISSSMSCNANKLGEGIRIDLGHGDRQLVPAGTTTEVYLPLGNPGQSISVRVDWGDGTFNNYTTSGIKSHTYTNGIPLPVYEGGDDSFYNNTPFILIRGTLPHYGYSFPESSGTINDWKNILIPTDAGNISLFDYSQRARHIESVPRFNISGLTSLEGAFAYTGIVGELSPTIYAPQKPIFVSQTGGISVGSFGVTTEQVTSPLPLTVNNLNKCFYNSTTTVSNQWVIGPQVQFMNSMFGIDAVSNNLLSPAFSKGPTATNAAQWNVQNVFTMRKLFKGVLFSNTSVITIGDITGWNTQSVLNMEAMFANCQFFNQDISNWNTSSCLNMSSMFDSNNGFNQPIGSWNVGAVTDMSNMFRNSSFDQDLNNWDVSNVTNMKEMFHMLDLGFKPNLRVGNWDVSNVTDMSSMFRGCYSFNDNIGGWDTSSVTVMKEMFSFTNIFNVNLNSWNTASVTDMSFMFNSASAFNSPLNNWDVSNVTNMSSMFDSAGKFNQPLNNWDTSSVTNMDSMFRASFNGAESTFNQDLSMWCVEQIPTKPTNFDLYANNWTLPRPNWGAPC